MDLSVKELKKLLILCQKFGVKQLKYNDLEFQISEIAIRDMETSRTTKRAKKASSIASESQDELDKLLADKQLTDEELLFYSSTPPGDT